MASPGELVRTIAEVLGLPEPTVVNHDRNLVVAGLRHKSGRGWSAAKVTARDATHLLTAVLGSSQVKDSASTVKRYSDTRPSDAGSSRASFAAVGIPEMSKLSKDHSFVDALESLISAAASGSLLRAVTGKSEQTNSRKSDAAPIIEVAAMTPGTAGEIRVAGTVGGKTACVHYALPTPWKRGRSAPPDTELDAWESRIKAHGADTDLEEYRRISAKTIMRLGELLASDQGGNMMADDVTTPTPKGELALDLLRGADEIAEFLFGDSNQRRKVYHLAETSRLPVFRLGAVLCARRSVILTWIAEQEKRGWSSEC